MADALAALVEAQAAPVGDDARLRDFMALQCDIARIKADAAQQRVERLRADLALLDRERPDEAARLRQGLRRLLEP